MGPDELCLEFADYIIDQHPNIAVDRYDLAYTIQFWVDDDLIPNLDVEHSCHHLADHIKTRHPSIQDDRTNLALTIQDFIDIIEARLNAQEDHQPESSGEGDPACAVEGNGIHQQVHNPHLPSQDGHVRQPTHITCVVNGHETWREIDHVEMIEEGSLRGPDSARQITRIIPQLREDEEVVWMLGDYRPHIIKKGAQS